jgi:L-alanine-DL-glutamate epimerase-like enolase superfamily enzyme
MGATISSVGVQLLAAEPDEVIAMSFGVLRRRTMALVQVTSADGTTGYGESWTNYPPWAGLERAATIRYGIAPLLLGRDATEVTVLHADLVAGLWPLGRQWGAPGPVTQAISGADIALWDRCGRARDVPVCELLGGTVRRTVPVYASSLGPIGVEEDAADCHRRGFDFVKLKVGFGPETDRSNLAAARRSLGPNVRLAVDANQRWSLPEAVAMAGALRDAGVVWVEEPTAGNDLADIEEFHRSTGLHVALGENLYLREAFEPYLRSSAVAVVQPDVSKSGGITELRVICERASAAGKAVMPHLYGGAVAFAATLQLAASCEAVERVEYDVRSNPLRDPLIRAAPVPDQGILSIPMGPGLGIDLDHNAVGQVGSEVSAASSPRDADVSARITPVPKGR